MVENVISFVLMTRERTLRSLRYLMRKYTPELSKAILTRNSHFNIASDLYNENVLPELIYTSMHMVDEPEIVKVVSLLTAIRKAVERDPNKFPVVLAAMKKQVHVTEVVEKIELEYYTRERLILWSVVLGCGLIISIITGIIAYHYMQDTCTPVKCADLDDHVLLNLTSLTQTELRDGYERCSNLTTLSRPFDELLRVCEGDKSETSDCFMKTWFHQWLCQDSSIGCWEDVLLLLQCLNQEHLIEPIEHFIMSTP